MRSFAAMITSRRVVLCALVMVGCALYGRTLPYPFAFDCWTYIQTNPLITDPAYLLQLADFAAFTRLEDQLGLSPNVLTDFLLRPVSYATFTGNYLLHGLNPAGFRAVNIALHLANALLLFSLLERLLRSAAQRGSVADTTSRFVPALATALFLFHPIQTESVTYIVQRSTLLVTGFGLATLWLYLGSLAAPESMRARLLRCASVLVLLVGMFVKESMFTVPLLLLLVETVLLGSSINVALRRLIPHLCLLPVVPLLVLAAGHLERATAAGGILNIINYSGYSASHYAVTQLCVVATYLRLLLVPYGQNIDPDFPLYTTLLQGRPLGGLVLLVLLMAVPVLVFRRRRHDVRSALLLFAVGWFFLGLSVSSGIVPLPDLMAESRVYGPSIGFFIAVAVGLDWLRDGRRAGVLRPWIAPAAMVLVVACGIATWKRNDVWRSNITLWQDTVAKSPGKERPWHNLGMAYLDAMRPREASDCFNRALQLNPTYVKSHEALVLSYTREGRPAEAVAAATAGLAIAPGNAVLHNNLGVVYADAGQLDAARLEFEKALRLRPGYASARMNLERVGAARSR